MNTLELKAEKIRLGLDDDDMADIIGCNHGDTYSKKERGIVQFKPSDIIKIAEALKLDYDKVNSIFFDGKLPTAKPNITVVISD